MRRAIGYYSLSLALLQPEATRSTQAWIIIIIQCEKAPGNNRHG